MILKTLKNRNSLIKIAVAGGFLISGGGYLTRWLITNKLKKSDFYRLSVVNFMAHKPLVTLMGEPISFSRPDLGNTDENYSTEKEAKFVVPVFGSEHKGSLLFEASRNPEEAKPKWTLISLLCDVESIKEKKAIGRVKVPIKYSTMAEVPEGIYSTGTNKPNNASEVSVNKSPSPSPTTITSSA